MRRRADIGIKPATVQREIVTGNAAAIAARPQFDRDRDLGILALSFLPVGVELIFGWRLRCGPMLTPIGTGRQP
jgi:hypothetical protein